MEENLDWRRRDAKESGKRYYGLNHGEDNILIFQHLNWMANLIADGKYSLLDIKNAAFDLRGRQKETLWRSMAEDIEPYEGKPMVFLLGQGIRRYAIGTWLHGVGYVDDNGRQLAYVTRWALITEPA